MSRGTLMVIAKEPLPGAVKTRLCPPCTPIEAARLAEAALIDTLAAMAGAHTPRRLVVLEGAAGAWLQPGFDVTRQRGVGLSQRLEAAFEDCAGAGFVVAMDTPQVSSALLNDALDRLGDPGVDAVIGPTPDGGYWGIGFAAARPGAFFGVPMSTGATLARQLERLDRLGLCTAILDQLVDVDDIDDARVVAQAAPHTRFAASLVASGHSADGQQAMPEAAA